MVKYLENIKILSDNQRWQFKMYYQILMEESKKYNLTTITSEEEVYIKHFYDSILILKYLQLDDQKLIDVGSGAGFPGIPLKIICPNLDITLVEPTGKRAKFLQLVIDTLKLEKIKIINDRAENIIQNNREQYDFATARAVAPLNILLELLTPFVKVNGKVIALKGSSYQEELSNAKSALKILNLSVENIYHDYLPKEMGERPIIIFKKLTKTKLEYPRIYSKIKKRPL